MTARRASVVAAVAALLLAIAWFAWRDDQAAPPAPATAAPATGAPAAPAVDAAAAGQDDDRAAASARAVVGADDARVFEVHGRILKVGSTPMAGAEVLARRGRPGERSSLLDGLSAKRDPLQPAGPDDFAFLQGGEVLARTAVAADGAFVLRSAEPHLRLELLHDFYGLYGPTIVHVPMSTRRTDVVLVPFLGGCIHGRLLGDRVAQVRTVRLLLEPDPMAAASDINAFFGAILSAARRGSEPAADGTFAIRAIPTGAELLLIADGEQVAGRAAQPPMQPGELREVALPVGGAVTLAVCVRTADGKPVAGASLRAVPAALRGDITRAAAKSQVKTDADGRGRLVGLLPGRHALHAGARGYVEQDLEVAVPSAAEIEVTLDRGGEIAGVVVDAGGVPVAAARVATFAGMKIPLLGDLASQLGLDLVARIAEDGTPTDEQGRFQLGGIDGAATFHVIAAHPDFAGGIARDVRGGDRDVRIVLEPAASVRGRVVADEDGKPLTNFDVELQTTMFLAVTRPVRREQVTAATDGSFQLAGLPPGAFTLATTAEGFSEKRTEVKLAAGQVADAGELRLPRGAALRGHVRDQAGAPVARATVRPVRGGLSDHPALAILQGNDDRCYTDDQGAFVLEGLPPGRLQLAASAAGFATAKSSRLALAAGVTIEGVLIVLDHGGSLAGRLRVAAGERIDQFMLLAQETNTQKTFELQAAADGAFRGDNLEPGRYQVQAMRTAALQAMQGSHEGMRAGREFNLGKMMSSLTENMVSQRCVVRAGETTNVDLDATELSVGTKVTLRVTVGGQPLDEGMIEATLLEDGRVRAAFLEHGEASIAALRPGRLRVQLRAGLTLTPVGGAQDLEIPTGTDHFRATIELPGGELSGRVVDIQSGQPLRAALVRLLHENARDDDDHGAAITDENGAFAFRALAPGSYGLVAADDLLRRSDTGTASRQDGIRLDAGARVTGIELRAHPAAGVTAVVTDEENAPVAGATLVAVDADGRPLGGLGLAVSGQDGRAHLGGLPRGRGRIVGRAPGLAPDASAIFELRPGEALDVPLRLSRGTLVVVDAIARDGRALAGADLTARCGDGPWFPALLLLESRQGGRLELGRLAPGDWEFRLAHPSCGTFTVRRTIAAGATVTVLATPPQ